MQTAFHFPSLYVQYFSSLSLPINKTRKPFVSLCDLFTVFNLVSITNLSFYIMQRSRGYYNLLNNKLCRKKTVEFPNTWNNIISLIISLSF